MTEEEAFQREIEANPQDPQVFRAFADWLEERSDPRAELMNLKARIVESENRPELPTNHHERTGWFWAEHIEKKTIGSFGNPAYECDCMLCLRTAYQKMSEAIQEQLQ